MAQGPRGGWVRVVFAGVGAALCAGALGCMNTDKPKDYTRPATNTRQLTPGLPGTPTLQPGSGSALGAARTGQQPYNQFGANGTATGTGAGGVQQTGGFGSPTGRTFNQSPYNTGTAAGSGFGSGGGSIAPSVQPGGYQVPQGTGNGTGGTPQPDWGSAGTSGSRYPTDPPPVNLSPDPYPPLPPGDGTTTPQGVAPLGPIAPALTPPGRGG